MPVFAVITARGANWDRARDIREQPFWDEHAAFADQLVARGLIILGGPIATGADEDIALLAVEAADEPAARSIFDADPWTVHQVFRIKSAWPWTVWLDGRTSRTSRTSRSSSLRQGGEAGKR
jgi:uncharacterized protein